MSTNSKPGLDQDMDLSDVFGKVNDIFSNIGSGIYRFMMFIRRNIILFSSLFVIGAALGYLLDKQTKVYKHELIVSPNFGSVDYLYSKIDLLNSKIKENDTVFFKAIGVKQPKKLVSIEIEPVIDIYSFVNDKSHGSANNAQNTQNFELVKLLSEDGDINKVIKGDITSKNYSRHTIKVTTDGKTDARQSIIPILDYLNNNPYYGSLQKIYQENSITKIKEDQAMIAQIDGILREFSNTSDSKQKSDKLVYYNDNTQINEILNTKNYLISELGGLRVDLIGSSKVIKDNSSVINVRDKDGVNNKLKYIFPLVLVFLGILAKGFVGFTRSQRAKYEAVK